MAKKKRVKKKELRKERRAAEAARLSKAKGSLGKSRKRTVIKPTEEPAKAHDYSYTQGREVSWLHFETSPSTRRYPSSSA